MWFLFDYCAAVQAVHSCHQIVLKLCSCKRKNLDVLICFGYDWELTAIIILGRVLSILQLCHFITLFPIALCCAEVGMCCAGVE